MTVCPHCQNDDERMMEEINRRELSLGYLIIYLCQVCGNTFLVKRQKV